MSENVVIFPAREGDTGDENDAERCFRVWLNRQERQVLFYIQEKFDIKSRADALRACIASTAAQLGLKPPDQ